MADDDTFRQMLHDAIFEAALLPATGPMLARAAFRLRTALLGLGEGELHASAHGLHAAIDEARLRHDRVPSELAAACARVREWLVGREDR